MIEEYIKKLENFVTYDDLKQLGIKSPHILRLFHAQETIIKEMQGELKNLRDLLEGFLCTRKLLGESK